MVVLILNRYFHYKQNSPKTRLPLLTLCTELSNRLRFHWYNEISINYQYMSSLLRKVSIVNLNYSIASGDMMTSEDAALNSRNRDHQKCTLLPKNTLLTE